MAFYIPGRNAPFCLQACAVWALRMRTLNFKLNLKKVKGVRSRLVVCSVRANFMGTAPFDYLRMRNYFLNLREGSAIDIAFTGCFFERFYV